MNDKNEDAMAESIGMLEKMGDFFDTRIDEYETHQLTCIEAAEELYDYTARCLPGFSGARILDLGCGTGLELERYYRFNPSARVVGIDLAVKMLDVLRKKLPDKELTLIAGSYFDIPLEEQSFDGAVSVESLHHFTKEEKIPLYRKINRALKNGCCFILTDYFSASDAEEQRFRTVFSKLKKQQNISDNCLYHFDTPLTVQHELEALTDAGFSTVRVLKKWGSTYSIKAVK